jgi:hypothetical protein
VFEAGDAVIDSNVKTWGNNLDNNILIEYGRQDSLINGKVNPYYIPNLSWEGSGMHLLGSHRYNEEEVTLEFDIFTYDFGDDGIPGDPFIDNSGDGEYQRGESLSPHWLFPNYGLTFDEYLSDCGLDGICKYTVRPSDRNGDGDFDDWNEINDEIIYETPGELNPLWEEPDADGTEGDGLWQPGDGWLDLNGNGQVDIPVFGIGDSWEEPTPGENDVWPIDHSHLNPTTHLPVAINHLLPCHLHLVLPIMGLILPVFHKLFRHLFHSNHRSHHRHYDHLV